MLIKYNLLSILEENVTIIEPVGYLDMLMLEKYANKILTDSGGVQKEAYVFKVPCITLRNNTEWVETIDEGWNILAGCDNDLIVRSVLDFNPSQDHKAIFGNGKASEKICSIIDDYLV